MKRSSLVGFTVAVMLAVSGCTVTHPIQRPQTLEQFQALVGSQQTSVTLLHAHPEGSHSPVSLSLAPGATPAAALERPPSLELSNLRGYEVKRRAAGTLEGLGIGLLAGFAVGALVGAADGNDGPCHNDDGGCVMFSSGDKALALGLLGALPGALIGALVGLSVGQTDRYLFTNEPARP